MFFASTKAKECYTEVDYSKMEDIFIMFGKETKGLPESLLKKYIEKTIRIPMKENLRSLNLSNSVAIITYEILRQRKFNDLEQISEYFN
jgi:tRNA (cytidine/uridine-2'-O-)-methyltransferase